MYSYHSKFMNLPLIDVVAQQLQTDKLRYLICAGHFISVLPYMYVLFRISLSIKSPIWLVIRRPDSTYDIIFTLANA